MAGLRRNKKGSLLDILFVAGVLLMFGLIVLLGFKFAAEFNTLIQDSDQVDTLGKQNMQELTNVYPGVIDNSFLLLTIGLSLGALVLAALVRISPIFLALFLIALVFVIFFAGVLSNIYQEMAANSELISQADQLTFISNILTFLPLIIGVIGSLLALVMYKSWRDVQGI